MTLLANCNFCDAVCVMTDSCENVMIRSMNYRKGYNYNNGYGAHGNTLRSRKKITGKQIFFCASYTFIKPFPFSTCHMPHYHFANSNTVVTDDDIVSTNNCGENKIPRYIILTLTPTYYYNYCDKTR
jgi:hypothetical protein